MKDKTSLRLVMIGFLSGIVLSGLALILITIVQADQVKKSILLTTPASIARIDKESTSNAIDLIDLNLASLDDLKTLPGIGEAKAKAIIDFRDRYGDFEEINELTYVPGIGNSLFNSIQDLVIINLDRDK